MRKATLTKKNNAFRWIPIAKLEVIHAEAQRPLNSRNAARIANDFDPDLFGIVTVAESNGSDMHHIIDGQTRVEALRLLGWLDQSVPCVVKPTHDVKDEARMFDGINAGSVKPTALDLFLVRVTAGAEVETDVANIIRGQMFDIGSGGHNGNVSAVNACVYVYKKFGSEVFAETLEIIVAAWGHVSEGVNAAMIRGVAEMVNLPEVDSTRLTHKMSKMGTAGSVLGRGRTSQELHRGTLNVNVTRVLVDEYNVGLRSNKVEWK